MLDAIVAATEHLVVTYTGANETTGPAAAARRTPRRAARHPRRHRRRGQGRTRCGDTRSRPSTARNLDAGRPVLLRRRRRCAGALRGRPPARRTSRPGRRRAPGAWRATWSSRPWSSLPQAPGQGVPAPPARDRAGRRGRGGDRRAARSSSTAWCSGAVGDRMLHDLRAGRTRAGDARQGVAPRRAPAGAARLAPGAEDRRPGRPRSRRSRTSVTQGVRVAARDVDVDLGGGRRLRGTVTDLYGDRIVKVSFSRLGPTPPARGLGPAAGAVRRLARAARGPPAPSAAVTSAAPTDRTAFASVDDAGALLATWSRSTTPACASRCRCRSRPATPGRAPTRATRRPKAEGCWSRGPVRQRERGRRPRARVGARRRRWPPCSSSVRCPARSVADQDTRLGALACRLWKPILERSR